MNSFPEHLKTLIEDSEKTVPEVADVLGLPKNTLYRYLRNARSPELPVFIRIADHFRCTLEFLAGRDATYYEYAFRPCASFSEQLKKYMKENRVSIRKLHRETKIPEITISSWVHDIHVPNLANAMIVTQYFEVTLDNFLER